MNVECFAKKYWTCLPAGRYQSLMTKFDIRNSLFNIRCSTRYLVVLQFEQSVPLLPSTHIFHMSPVGRCVAVPLPFITKCSVGVVRGKLTGQVCSATTSVAERTMQKPNATLINSLIPNFNSCNTRPVRPDHFQHYYWSRRTSRTLCPV